MLILQCIAHEFRDDFWNMASCRDNSDASLEQHTHTCMIELRIHDETQRVCNTDQLGEMRSHCCRSVRRRQELVLLLLSQRSRATWLLLLRVRQLLESDPTLLQELIKRYSSAEGSVRKEDPWTSQKHKMA